jgi:hypothetical protein
MKKRKTNRTAESLGDRIARMSEEDRQDWTDETYIKITDEAVMALHLAGWKIVDQDDPNHLWPFSTVATGCRCPPWCEDLDAATATPADGLRSLLKARTVVLQAIEAARNPDKLRERLLKFFEGTAAWAGVPREQYEHLSKMSTQALRNDALYVLNYWLAEVDRRRRRAFKKINEPTS